MFLEKFHRFVRHYRFSFAPRKRSGPTLPLIGEPGDYSVLDALKDAVASNVALDVRPNGDIIEITNLNSGLCLTIAGGSADRNTVAVQYTCDGHPSRRWRYMASSANSFRLVNMHSGLCLTIAGGGTDRNTTAVQYPCDQDRSRDWQISRR